VQADCANELVQMSLKDLDVKPAADGVTPPTALAERIAGLSKQIEKLLAEGAAFAVGHEMPSALALDQPLPRAEVQDLDQAVATDLEGWTLSALRDRVRYLESALSQRSAEADEWMAAGQVERGHLAVAQDQLAHAQAALAQERLERERAESSAGRLAAELELLTNLLHEIQAADADRRSALEAQLAETSDALDESRRELDDHAQQIRALEAEIEALVTDAEIWRRDQDRVEKGLADERHRTDQYRDVAERLQTLCTYQRGEAAELREKIANLESEAAALRSARTAAEDLQERQRIALQRLRQTLSWRATAPVRNLAKVLKKMMKVLRSLGSASAS
jgi:chromosome segregation ATPase